MDFGGLRHVAFALGAFRGKQVTPRGMLPPHFSRPGDRESLRNGLPGFAARNRLWHKARKIAQPARVTTGFAAENCSLPILNLRNLRRWKTSLPANRTS